MPENKTEWIFGEPGASSGRRQDDSLPPLGGGRDDRTHPAGLTTDTTGPADGRTEIYRPEVDEEAEKKGGAFEEEIDPVVGWLVVIAGPGRGRAVPLGVGVNSIGRDPGERAPLPFGDAQISGKAHATVVYDDGERTFYVAHASGKNLTRLNGKVVTNLTKLASGDIVEFGRGTKTRFVAFCDERFDWSDPL